MTAPLDLDALRALAERAGGGLYVRVPPLDLRALIAEAEGARRYRAEAERLRRIFEAIDGWPNVSSHPQGTAYNRLATEGWLRAQIRAALAAPEARQEGEG